MKTPAGAESHSRCLILFVREPVAGRVKTRLEPALGIKGTLALYRRLLDRQISLLNHYHNVDCQLWVEGDSAHEAFSEFNGPVFQQFGDDLGLRMNNALANVLDQYGSAILIGCDCPEYSHAYFDRGFLALEQGADVVLGPARDGGYVLVGLRQAEELIFRGMDWGTDAVLQQTRECISALGLNYHELETLQDIDEPQDLILLNGTTMLQ